MTMPRSKIVDPDLTPWYHIISRTVRGEYLLEGGDGTRKQELEERLEQLSEIFSIEVAGYAVLDNHLHNLVYLNPRQAKRWSKAEVLRRWARLHPPRGPDRKRLKSIDQWVRENVRNQKLVRQLRKRLMNLGWFMKELKEPLARKANAEDGVRGPFWAGRYAVNACSQHQYVTDHMQSTCHRAKCRHSGWYNDCNHYSHTSPR